MKNEFTRGNSTFISTALAAELTGYSQDYISQLARDELVSSTKVSNRRFVDRDELLQYAETNKKDFHFENVPVMHRPEHFIPTAEAANLSGYSTDYIAELARDGRIESGKEGGRWFVHRDQILAYASEHKKRFSSRDTSVVSTSPDTKQQSAFTAVTNEAVKEKSDRATARWRKTRDGLKAIGEKLPTKSISRLPAVAMAFMLAVILGIGGLGMANMSITDSNQQLASVQEAHNEKIEKETLTTALAEARYSASMAAAAVSSIGDFLSRPIKNFFVDTLFYGVAGLLQLGDFLVADQELYTAPSITYTQTDSSDTNTPSQPATPPAPGSAGSLTYITTTNNNNTNTRSFTGSSALVQSVTRLASMVTTLSNRMDSEPSNEVSALVRDYVADQISDVADLARANVEANLYTLPRNINLEGIEIENLTKTNRLSVTATTSIDGSTFFVSAANNRVGIGTSTPRYALHVSGDFGVTGTTTFSGPANFATTTIDNLTVTNSSTTNAYITDLLGDDATLTNLEGTNATITNATTTNFFATLANFTTSFFDTLTATVATITDLTVTNSTTTNATSTNLFAASANFTSAIINTLTATIANFTNFTAENATTTNLVATEANTTNLTASGTTNLQTTSIANLNVSGTATTSNLVVTDDATFGDTVTDSFAVNSTIGSHLVPNSNATYNLGSPSFYWDVAYIDTINANNLSAASSSISGTAAEDFTINSDNSSVDGERASIIFYRGQVTPNAVFSWDNVADRFNFNQPALFWNEAASTTIPTLTVQGTAGQTADLFQVSSSSGAVLTRITADGSIVAPSASTTNLIATNATTTNAYIQTLAADTGDITDLTADDATITSATTTNFFSSLANFTTAFFDTLTATVATITNLTVTNSTTTNATSTNLFAASANFTSAIINTLTATIANFTNLTADNATTTNLASTDITASGSTSLQSTAAASLLVSGTTTLATTSATNFSASSTDTDTLVSTDATITNATTTNLVTGNLDATGTINLATSTINAITIGGDTISDFTGTGLSVSANVLAVDQAALDVEGFSTSLTAGSIAFSNGSNLAQDNANLFWDDTNNRLGIGTTSPAVSLAIYSTDALLIPVGTTAQRPTGATGYIRYNTSTNEFEGFLGGTWGSLGGGVIDADGDTYITAEESTDEDFLRFYTAGSERMTISNTGTTTISGHLLPGSDDTYDLGSATNRWRDLYLGPDTLHIGTAANEATLTYSTSTSRLTFQNNTNATGGFQFLDADGGTPILNIDTTNERVGIGTANPGVKLHILTESDSDSQVVRLENKPITDARGATELHFYAGNKSGGTDTHNTAKIYSQFDVDGGGYDNARLTFSSPTGVNTWTDVLTIKNGNVGIGTASPSTKLHVVGEQTYLVGTGGSAALHVRNTSTGPAAIFGDTGGNVGIGTASPSFLLEVDGSAGKPGGGSWSDSSDERLKENITALSSPLAKITALEPVTFDWKNPGLHGGERASGGFIAQEVAKVFPEWVGTTNAKGADAGLVGPDGTAYTLNLPFEFDAYIVGAIKELAEQVQQLAQNRFWEEDMNGEKPAENFLAAVRIALEDFMGDATARFKEVVVQRVIAEDTVTAKNTVEAGQEICIDGECITKAQLSALIDLSNNGTGDGSSSGMDSLEPRGEEDDTTSTDESSSDDPDTTSSSTDSGDTVDQDGTGGAGTATSSDDTASSTDSTTASFTDTNTEGDGVDEETATTSDSDSNTATSDITDDASDTNTEEGTTITDEETTTDITTDEDDPAPTSSDDESDSGEGAGTATGTEV